MYIVVRGTGTFYVDGEELPVAEGSVVRVDPAGERAWQEGEEDLYFICIQAEKGESLPVDDNRWDHLRDKDGLDEVGKRLAGHAKGGLAAAFCIQ